MTNINDWNHALAGGSFPCAKELQGSLIELVRALQPNIFLTLVFNQHTSPISARQTLKHFYSGIERRCFGREFYKRAPAERLIALAFPEHITSNFHYHLIGHLPRHQHVTLPVYAKMTWKKLCPAGSLDVHHIGSDTDRTKIASYSCKEVFKAQNYENFIVSTEFWNSSLTGCFQQEILAQR
jgi:hypothetical protein